MVVAVGEFGRSPLRGVSTSGNNNDADGRDHWPYCYTCLVAGGGVRRGFVYGRSRQHRLRPAATTRSIPAICWPRSITASASTRTRIVYNHLNQPREMVPGEVVRGMLG